ncbi:universal stress protein [Streptomyces sp. NBC_00572]|uniref:universal stress protein n=1 Tax=Streptomyces sp. NBC_00572 TaxID=2903664 RepID=UPI00225274E0|nr:universal stress protein [Streptomyces sp. NBC_00572]MCX4985023.1 universal stress protein [Streptomyces sp. NBC_00572]
MVGVDGSESSRAALTWSFEEADLRRCALRAVAVWQPPVFTLHSGDTLFSAERRLLSETTAGWAEKHPDVRLTHEVRVGSPVETLADAAEHALGGRWDRSRVRDRRIRRGPRRADRLPPRRPDRNGWFIRTTVKVRASGAARALDAAGGLDGPGGHQVRRCTAATGRAARRGPGAYRRGAWHQGPAQRAPRSRHVRGP